MKLSFVIFLSLFFCLPSLAQYWQQEANFEIEVRLDDKKNTLKGNASIEYINHSPDSLSYIWFHIWPNAYSNKKTAFAKQNKASFKDKGYMDSLSFRVNNTPARTEPHEKHIDIIKLILPQILPPGDKILITTPFFVDLPQYVSRSGHERNQFMITQWYPKPAVYDRKGWHPMPYLNLGEFYNDYGSYHVKITVPSSYIVAATGRLQNAEELEQYRAIGRENVLYKSPVNLSFYQPPPGKEKTLVFTADNVADFAWFTSQDFVIRYDTIQIDKNNIEVFAFHLRRAGKQWLSSTEYIKDATKAYSGWLGTYPYPVVQAVQGPANSFAGGMEYPMITLITNVNSSAEGLDAVIAHEVGHNWFMSVLGSNERLHPWLDEGLNTYYQFRYEAEKYRNNSAFMNHSPPELRALNAEAFQRIIYEDLESMVSLYKIDLPSTAYDDISEYGMAVYFKGALWVYGLERRFGRQRLDEAMKNYYEEWKFRHPYPEDFRSSLEKSLQEDLEPYFKKLKKPGRLQ